MPFFANGAGIEAVLQDVSDGQVLKRLAGRAGAPYANTLTLFQLNINREIDV